MADDFDGLASTGGGAAEALQEGQGEARDLARELDGVAQAASRSQMAAGSLARELERAGTSVGRSLAGPGGIGAAEGALDRLTRQAEAAGRSISNEVESGFKRAARGAAEALVDGEFDLGRLGRRFASDLAAGLAESTVDGSLFQGRDTGNGSASGFVSTALSVLASIKHGGGVAGEAGGRARGVGPAVFEDARRYHGGGVAGLDSREVPAILERGEAVFTPAQLRLLGDTVGRRRDDGGGTAAPVNMTLNVSSPDAGGFRAAQGQILADAGRLIQRHLRRNA